MRNPGASLPDSTDKGIFFFSSRSQQLNTLSGTSLASADSKQPAHPLTELARYSRVPPCLLSRISTSFHVATGLNSPQTIPTTWSTRKASHTTHPPRARIPCKPLYHHPLFTLLLQVRMTSCSLPVSRCLVSYPNLPHECGMQLWFIDQSTALSQ